MKTIKGNKEYPFTCAGCGKNAPIWAIIDNWAVIEEDGVKKYYCIECQFNLGIGWGEKRDKKNKKQNP